MRYRAVVLMFFIAFALAIFAWPHVRSMAAALTDVSLIPAQSRAQIHQRATPTGTRNKPRIDYTHFSHRTAQHQRACDACHQFPSSNWKSVRKGDAAFPDVTEYPEHASCLNCHRQQFFTSERPAPSICSVCHINVSPRNTARRPFPNPLEIFQASKEGRNAVSEFAVNFPHEKHKDVVAQSPANFTTSLRIVMASFHQEKGAPNKQSAPQSQENCAVCHQTYQPQDKSDEEFATKRPKNLSDDIFWLKKGTFKTTPTSHSACFTCHSPDTGIAPTQSDCAACHKLQLAPQATQTQLDFDPKLIATMNVTDNTMLREWGRRESSATFRHEAHPDVSCSDCHHTATMNTFDRKTLKVPVQSCGGGETGCHITRTADEGGILNFEIDKRKASAAFQCTKCHLIFGKEPTPKSHLDAITQAAAQTK